MRRKARRAALAAMLALAVMAPAKALKRYSWYADHGPFFETPAQVCVWAGGLYEPGSLDADMGIDAKGWCRADGGRGDLYIPPYAVEVYRVAIDGPQALRPAADGATALQFVRLVDEQGRPAPAGLRVTLAVDDGPDTEPVHGVTGPGGLAQFRMRVPVAAGALRLVAACAQCEVPARRVLTVGFQVPPARACRADRAAVAQRHELPAEAQAIAFTPWADASAAPSGAPVRPAASIWELAGAFLRRPWNEHWESIRLAARAVVEQVSQSAFAGEAPAR